MAKNPTHVARAKAMLTVAEIQADTLSPEIDIMSLPPETDALVNDGILVATNRTVYFQHDILGDLARLQTVIGNENNLERFVEAVIRKGYARSGGK